MLNGAWRAAAQTWHDRGALVGDIALGPSSPIATAGARPRRALARLPVRPILSRGTHLRMTEVIKESCRAGRPQP
jgi:hypothetical protein